MNIIFAVTLLLISSSWASELNRSKKQINFGSDDERQGYFYDKPSISFELPTQKPSTTFVAATTNSPVPTGYNYPKPSIAFEENPKPIVIGVTPSKNFGSGGGQTSVTTTFNKYDFSNPRVEIQTQKPSSFGIFGSGGSTITSNVNRYDTLKPTISVNVNKVNEQKTSTFTSKFPSVSTGSGQTSFVSNVNKYEETKPKIEYNFSTPTSKPSSQSSLGIFGSGGSSFTSNVNVNRDETSKFGFGINGGQKTSSQSTFTSKFPSVGTTGSGQSSFVSTANKFDYNKPKIEVVQTKPVSTFGSFGSGVQKTNSQTTYGSLTPSVGIGGGSQTTFTSTANKFDYNKPKIEVVQTKPVSTFGGFGSGIQKTTSQTTFGSLTPSVGIGGGSQTTFTSTANKFDYNKPKIEVVQTKPVSTFGGFGSGVQKTTSQTSFGSLTPSVGIGGGSQTTFTSTANKFDYNKPKIEVVQTKPVSTFGSFGSGVQKTTSQTTFGSRTPSVGIGGGSQTTVTSNSNKFDYNKPKIEVVQTKPVSTFGSFGSGIQKTTSQTTFGSLTPSVGIGGGSQTTFTSTANKFDYNKPKIEVVQTKPVSTFGSFGSGVQKTTSQTTFGSRTPSVGIGGGSQTTFTSNSNKFDYSKPKIEVVQTKPVSTFGSFGSGVQKTTSQTTYGSLTPSVGIGGGSQTTFTSTANKFDYNKPKIEVVQTKPVSTFGSFGGGVQKTTSQTTFGSIRPPVGIGGGSQTTFTSNANKFDYNKPKIEVVQTKPVSTFGSFGSGVQKTTSQTTFGSLTPSVGTGGGSQTTFTSTANKFDYSKPKIEVVQTKPLSTFGSFGSGVQKTTSQTTFGSLTPSVGTGGGSQTTFTSTANKFDYNKPKIEVVQTKPVSTFGSFGSGVQKTTSQTTFGSLTPFVGTGGGSQTTFTSTANKFDYSKPKIEVVQTKPLSTFGSFGSGVQKTTSQTTFGSLTPSVGTGGGSQTTFTSTANKFDYNKPKIEVVQTKPVSTFGSFGSGVQKTTSQTTFGSLTPSVGTGGGSQTTFTSTANKFDYSKPKIEVVQTKPLSTFGSFGSGVQKTTSQTTFGSLTPSVGTGGGSQTTFTSTANKFDYNKPKIEVVQTKPVSTFGSFGSGVQKTTSQTTFGSLTPFVGTGGGSQTTFTSTANKFDYSKPKIEVVQTKPLSTFGSFGSGVQKTTSQTTFGSLTPSVGTGGGSQTTFTSTANKFDYNKPKIEVVQTKPVSTFGSFGSGVQKTTSQTTFGSLTPFVGTGGGSQTTFTSTANKFDYSKPKIEVVQTKPVSTSFGSFGSGVQKTTSQTTFGSRTPSVGIGGGSQTTFTSTANKFDYNKPKIEVVQTKPVSTFGSFGSGVQKTTSQTTFGSLTPSVGIGGGSQTTFTSTANKFDYSKPKIQVVQTKPASTFGGFGSGVQKTTSQTTFGSLTPSVGIGGGSKTTFTSTSNKFDYNKPKIEVVQSKPASTFGGFGSGIQKTTSQSTYGSLTPSVGIGGGSQTTFTSTANKFDYSKPKIEVVQTKPVSTFGSFGSGVQKTTSQTTYGSLTPSVGIGGGSQTTFTSTANKFDYNKPKIEVVQTKPVSTFGSFGSGVQKTTSQTTFGSITPSVGIGGGSQTTFTSTANKFDYNKPKIEVVQTKPVSTFGSFGSGVQKTTSQTTFGSRTPSVGIGGGSQTTFTSNSNKFDYNKPKIEVVQTKPVSTFGSFGSGVQKTTSQTTYGFLTPSVGIGGGSQTTFTSTANKFDYNKPKIDVVQTKAISTFGGFGSGVQKTTSQTTFGSRTPSVGIGGGSQTTFTSTANKFDYNKPKIEVVQTKPVSTFGSFGSGVQKTTSQTTYGSLTPSIGIGGGSQTTFTSTANKFDYNKPKIEVVQTKPVSTFGSFGSGVQKTNSQTTFGSIRPSVGIGGGSQTTFTSTANKFDYNKPKIEVVQTKPVSTFGSFGSGVQKTTSQTTYGSLTPSVGIGGGSQTTFTSTANKFDYNKPKIEVVQTKPVSTFGSFGSGIQKTTSQTTFGSSVPSGGSSGSGQTSFVSTFNKYDVNKPKIDLPKPTPKPVDQSSFGVFGTGGSSFNTQKTTSLFSSKFPSTGSVQTSVYANVNKYEVNKPRVEFSTSKPTSGSSFGSFGGSSGSRFGSTASSSKVSGFDYSTQRPSTNAPEYLPPLGSTFQKTKYNDDIKYF